MEQESVLEGYSDAEKGAYLGAIASMATADRSASEEELQYLQALCESAGLSNEQTTAIIQSASNPSDDNLQQHLDVLKNSELRFPLITDLISFAQSDSNYSDAEKQKVQEISQYLNVNPQQFSLLNQVTQQAKEQVAANPEQATSSNFLASGGLQEKLQSAGINTSSLLKGLLGIAGPIILSRMLSRGMGGRTGGGMLGGMLGGGGFGGGGLGSLIGMLSGGSGFGNTGGLLSRILRGGF